VVGVAANKRGSLSAHTGFTDLTGPHDKHDGRVAQRFFDLELRISGIHGWASGQTGGVNRLFVILISSNRYYNTV
jgi:hypothetical protein